MTDRIEKTIDLNAAVDRVWRALTDHREFGAWFGVRLDAPFAPGQASRGQKTNPCNNGDVRWNAVVQKMEKPRLFSFTWQPWAIDPKVDHAGETPTLIEFTLEKIAGGTRLKVVESGFDKLPAHRRAEAFPKHETGWGMQMQNIAKHLDDENVRQAS